MTHRNALIFSLVVTLLLSAGVLIGRDRLFAAETVVDQPASIPVSQSPGSVQRASLAETGPRIVDVPLPSSLGSGSERAKARQGDDERVPARESESGNDHDWDEEEHDDD